jgi:hypothetical protein
VTYLSEQLSYGQSWLRSDVICSKFETLLSILSIVVDFALQGTAQLFKLGILFNRAEAAAHEETLKSVPRRSAVKLLLPPCPFSDSDDDVAAKS